VQEAKGRPKPLKVGPRPPMIHLGALVMVTAMMVTTMMVSFMFFVSRTVVCAVSCKPRCGSQHRHHETNNHKDKYSATRSLHSTSLLSWSRSLLRNRIYAANP
jgi:hypothetical protein